MPIPNESANKDAPASPDTGYCFVPNDEGAFTSASKNNTFMGSLSTKLDEDWIIIELQAGKEYTFTLKGAAVEGVIDLGTVAGAPIIPIKLEDPILMLLDSKGGHIETSDDVDPEDGDLSSEIVVAPDEDGKFYLSVSAYTGNPGQSNSGGYELMVTERTVGPADIKGTIKADKLEGTDKGELIVALEGNDVVNAGPGDDTVDAGDGNDLVTGGPGADMLDGGDGTDTVSYKYSPEGEMITINLRGNLASGGDATGDDLEGFEYVLGAQHAMNMLTGDRGNNALLGGTLDDVLVGGRGNDALSGNAGDDELDGGDGDDTLTGGYGADELTGGDGDDTAVYGGSMMGVTVRLHSQTVMGGDAEGDTWGDLVTVEYDNPELEPPADERVLEETVPDIINLVGSDHADVLAGDSRDNVISGGRGDDKLYGGPGGGKDTLSGGHGDDMIFGGIGDDTLHGGAGDDLLSGGRDSDSSYGGPGSDMIYATVANDTGRVDDRVIDGWTGTGNIGATADLDESVEDAMGNDPRAVDTVSFEKVERGVHTGDDGVFTLSEVDAADTPFTLANDPVEGVAGAGNAVNIENIIGSAFNDSLRGNNEANVIEGGDGADYLDGGTSGESDEPAVSLLRNMGDTVSYENSDRDVAIDLEDDIAIGGHAQGDTIRNFENVIGSAYGDELTGSDDGADNDPQDGLEGRNRIWGMDGEDEIDGGTGTDFIEGGAGADELDGGTNAGAATEADDNGADPDDDTVIYATSDEGVSVNLSANTVSGGHAEGDELEVQKGAFDHDGDDDTDPLDVSTFESVTGSMHNDRLTGDHRDNTLNGLAGDDTLRGHAGEDTLIGGPGADILDGGEEEDEEDDMVPTLDEDGETTVVDGNVVMEAVLPDTASYVTAMAGVTVDLHSRKGTGGDAEGDTYRGIEQYMGSSNDDTFIAGEGIDRVNAGAHNMDYAGKRTDGDTISYEESEEGVTLSVNLADGVVTVDPANADDGDNDINFATDAVLAVDDDLSGFENITGSEKGDSLTTTGTQGDGIMTGSTLMGLGGNDTLVGGGVNDVLMGGKGRDTIVGGAGEDRIVGGAGDDVMYGGGSVDADGAISVQADIVTDVFVFSPRDGSGVDIIKDFDAENDQLDLSAFGITDVEELVGNISLHDGEARLDLGDYGGGIILLEGITDLNDLDFADATNTDPLNMTDADGPTQTIEILDVVTDANPDGIFII